MHMVALRVIALLLLASTADQVAGQTPERVRLEEILTAYHALLDAYQQGDNKSVLEIGTWQQKRVLEVIGSVHTAGDIVREWDQGHFKAAAMLHTDAAMKKLEADEAQAAFHLQVASRLLVTGGAPLRGFARMWYLTAARLLRERARLLVAEGLLSIGRRHLPGDAVVLYESAVTQESIASHSAFVTETVVSTRPFAGSAQDVRNLDNTPVTGSDRKFTAWRAAMENAARWLAEALQADPSSELAQLHLGRVQSQRGKHEEASTLLRRLADTSAETDVAYLAMMFLGAQHQRRGRHDDAEQEYRRAMVRHLTAQSAYIALSEILQRRGRGKEAREALAAMLRTPAESRTEPWWWYLVEPIEHVQHRADALRKSVRK
jgi:tetratricopeptide (TPR) repeat protein